jgi:hypothetical protein
MTPPADADARVQEGVRRAPAFGEAMRRAKKAFNEQAMREGRTTIGEHALEDAVWAVYELMLGRRRSTRG